MNIYEKIDEIFSGESDDRPQWATEILDELKELKELIKNCKSLPIQNEPAKNISINNNISNADDFHKFMTYYRNTNKESTTIHYKNEIYKLNERGLIYNIATNRVISTTYAIEIYRSLYFQSQNAV